jgi:hypothetical protein
LPVEGGVDLFGAGGQPRGSTAVGSALLRDEPDDDGIRVDGGRRSVDGGELGGHVGAFLFGSETASRPY